ncbi:MAG: penicillin-binding protein activator LpoB [Spirochaetaceae bacterium]|jgi:uncharacterized protein (TIGR02722 family)|nr:penicillin-binding protein activator LpoB [Spirochaetaceae bacterium]
MKHFIMSCATVVLVCACASTPQEPVSSGRWDEDAIKTVCETLINSALTSPNINQFINDYVQQNGGRNPTVIVGSFKNDTSEHINTDMISSKMETAIINTGRLEFVAGGDLREELRAERQDQQYNASEDSAAGLGKEEAAVFMLNGSVRSEVTRSGNTTRSFYVVTAVLTNIEDNKKVWQDESEIQRTATQAKNKF